VNFERFFAVCVFLIIIGLFNIAAKKLD